MSVSILAHPGGVHQQSLSGDNGRFLFADSGLPLRLFSSTVFDVKSRDFCPSKLGVPVVVMGLLLLIFWNQGEECSTN